MKQTHPRAFPDQYLATLRLHFEQKSESAFLAARELGVQSLQLGLETLELAKIHEEALATLLQPVVSPEAREVMRLRGELFFNEANSPIEQTHRLAVESKTNLSELQATLEQRTLDLGASKRHLQVSISDRQSLETALAVSAAHSARLLAESRAMEGKLQAIAHSVLSANEVERKKMSIELNDEIAQTLLGIYVRMLALKRDVARHHLDLTHEIAVTQRLVTQSAKTIQKLAHQYGLHHESKTAKALAELSEGAE